jgi:hypothetical protein
MALRSDIRPFPEEGIDHLRQHGILSLLKAKSTSKTNSACREWLAARAGPGSKATPTAGARLGR